MPNGLDKMAKKNLNTNLRAAAASKQDEFYTQLSDIEKELRHYTKHFKGKTVLCNCDDPKVSNFFHYFAHNFEKLKLKKLITTCYKNCDADQFSKHTGKKGVYLEYHGDKNNNRVPDAAEIGIHEFKGDGDFRSAECVKLLKQADIVVTNPPFSLFREYVEQLVKYKKKFIVIGNKNSITYKPIFSLIQANKLWLGSTPMGTDMTFRVSEGLAKELVETKKHGSAYRLVHGVVMARAQACWFTNLDISKRHEELITFRKYTRKEYPKYDSYDAINVNRTEDIPVDYPGAMGVPISFLDKYNPEQFEIIDGLNRYSILDGPTGETRCKYLAQVNWKPFYVRFVIKSRRLRRSNQKTSR